MWLFGRPWTVIHDQNRPSCFQANPSSISVHMCNKKTIWWELVKFNLGGGGGGSCGPYVKSRGTKMSGEKPHHGADICITRDTHSHQCFIMGHNVKKMLILVIKWPPEAILDILFSPKFNQFMISSHIMHVHVYNLKSICLKLCKLSRLRQSRQADADTAHTKPHHQTHMAIWCSYNITICISNTAD